MIKVFHHNDLDGRCSGAIVKYLYEPQEVELFEIDYSIPFPIESIEAEDTILILDFSIEPEMMKRLLEITKDVVWIDHHKSAIEKYNDFGEDIAGIRKDGISGCKLTWQFLARDKPIPTAVEYISDYDCWIFDFENTEKFFFGLQCFNNEADSDIWYSLFDEADDVLINDIILKGENVIKYRTNFCADYVKENAFEVEFEGYNCIACNVTNFGSKLFDSLKDKNYDIMITFVYDGKVWKYGFYTSKGEIDVSKIAVKYGGGGHKGAGGAASNELLFNAKQKK